MSARVLTRSNEALTGWFRDRAESSFWGLYLTIALAVGWIAMATFRELEGLLRGMHLPEAASTGLGGLAGRAPSVLETVTAWKAFGGHLGAADPGRFVSAFGVARLTLVVDLVFIPAYLMVFGVILLRPTVRTGLSEATGGQQTDPDDPQPLPAASPDGPAPLERFLNTLFAMALLLAVVDVFEDAMLWTSLSGFWRSEPLAPGGIYEVAARVAWVLTFAKLLLAAGLVGALAILGVRFVVYRWEPIVASIHLVLPQLVVLGACWVLLTLRLQMPDVLLGLNWWRFLLVTLLSLGLGVVLWSFARRSARRAEWRRGHSLQDPRPFPVVRVWRAVVLASAAVAVVALVHEHGEAGVTVGLHDRLSAAAPALVPVVILLIVSVLGVLVRGVTPAPRSRDAAGLGGEILPRILGASVPAILGVAVIRASVAPMVYRREWVELWRVAWAGGAVLASVGLFWFLQRLDARDGKRIDEAKGWWQGSIRSAGLVGAVFAAGVWLALALNPWGFAPILSGAGVVVAFMIVLALFVGATRILAEAAAERYTMPPLFRALRMNRIPVFALVIVWAILAAAVGGGRHFEVRLNDDRTPGLVPITLREAFTRWIGTNTADLPVVDAGRPAVPLVLVAASGGGIRAGVWTALSMDCLFEASPGLPGCATGTGSASPTPSASRIFVGSGISGGSLGLVEYLAYLNQRAEGHTIPQPWVDQVLSDDYLSPALAWGLFVEVPRSFLGFGAMDRAEVMERAWERSWGSEGPASPMGTGFLNLQLDPAKSALPLIIPNGASVRDGCWINASAIDGGVDASRLIKKDPPIRLVGECQSLRPFEDPPRTSAAPTPGPAECDQTPKGDRLGRCFSLPGTSDVVDFLCSSQDYALSTAALFSARFPGASPSGRLDACTTDRAGVTFAIDGGYIEPSGAETLMGLWPHLLDMIQAYNAAPNSSACVVPFFVQLDNGYAKPAAPPKTRAPNELTAPIVGAESASRGARAERARAAAAIEFARPFPGPFTVYLGDRPLTDRFAQLVPLSHPGVEAPLGWSLSPAARDDLREQLVTQNVTDIEDVRGWLDGPLRCE